MQTKAPSLKQVLVPALFALLCIVLTFAVWQKFGGTTPLKAKGYRATLTLPQASNLFAGADVRVAGVNIGKVKRVTRAGNRAKVEIDVKPDFVPLRQGAAAKLRTKTLLGEAYLAIDPGLPSAQPIKDGGALTVAGAAPQQRLDDVLETFGPATRGDLRDVFAGVATAFRGRSSDVSDTLGDAPELTANLQTVLTTLDRQRPQLQQLIAGGADVLQAAGDRDADLRSAIVSGSQALDATGRRDRALAATVRALPPFARRLTAAANDLDAAATDLTPAVAALRPAARLLPSTLAEVNRAAPTFRTLLRTLTPTLQAGVRGLPALRRLVDSAAPALDQAYPAARQLIPLLQLFAASRRSVVGTFANVSQIQNGTIIGPGGKRIHYGNGLPTIWNEIVGGWIKRLPTNRQNPYPKPDSALDVGGSGLKSYDCRNTGNTLYLAAIGSAPECQTQGPWTFNGVTATFPHLTEAPK